MGIVISPTNIINWIVYIVLFGGIITSFIPGLPIYYICDFLIVLLFLLCAKKINRTSYGFQKTVVLLFFVLGSVSFIMYGESLWHYLWGIRNYGRFFLFFFLGVQFYERKKVDRILMIFKYCFYIHVLLTLYQYFILGLTPDFVGGLFGTDSGCNAVTNLYFVILICLWMIEYYNKESSMKKIIFNISLLFACVIMCELKIFYIEFILIILFYCCIAGIINFRTIKALGITIMICGVGILIFTKIFPNYAHFFTIENIVQQLTDTSATYSTANDLGRSSVFAKLPPLMSQIYGSQSVWIGIGIGNADYSSTFMFLNSSFFEKYSYLHYTWLMTAYLIIESGYLGLLLYVLFFVYGIVQCLFEYKKEKDPMTIFGALIYFACCIILFYNASLRCNQAYIIYFALIASSVYRKRIGKYD